MPLMVVYALAITAQLWKWPRMAVALILAIYGSLRPAEIIGLRRQDLALPEDHFDDEAKMRHRAAASQHVRVIQEWPVGFWIADVLPSDTWPEIWNGSWAAFKLRFDALQTEVLEGTHRFFLQFTTGCRHLSFQKLGRKPAEAAESGSLFACRKLMCKELGATEVPPRVRRRVSVLGSCFQEISGISRHYLQEVAALNSLLEAGPDSHARLSRWLRCIVPWCS